MNNTLSLTLNGVEDIFKQINASDNSSWLAQYRKANFDRYQALGLPTTKNEDWKYTNIKPLLEPQYKLASKKDISLGELASYIDSNDINIIFVNGHLDEKLSNFSTQRSFIVENLTSVLSNSADKLKQLLQKYAPEHENPFITLNNALLSHGIYIKVPANIVVEKPLHIIHITDSSAANSIMNGRTIIHMERSSQVSVMESHITLDNNLVYLANPLTDVYMEENSNISYCKAQRESLNAYHIGSTRVWQERSSNFDGFSFMNGGKITRNNVDIILNGEGSNAIINGLYCPSAEQLMDNHTSIDHRYPNCTSNQLYKGVLNDSSRAIFNGKIFVQPIAQLTNSYQLNKNLLLGKNCRVDTKPQLEIFADDVKCTHGATIGQLDENELFYLQTRGVARRTAIKMLAVGFVDELLNAIKSPVINRRIHGLLEPSFAQY